jgi:hypothetical protein
MNSECVFVDDPDGGKRTTYHVLIGLEVFKTGEHQPMAEKASAVLGTNIVKVPAVMTDNAAKDVVKNKLPRRLLSSTFLNHTKIFLLKKNLRLCMSTNFVDTCITHCGDLASKKHHDAMQGCLHSVIVK